MIQTAPAISTSDEVRYITVYDDAVDHEASDFVRYMQTFDLDLLKIRTGAVPTVFILRPCLQSEVRRASIAAQTKVEAGLANNLDVGGELLRIGLIGAENLHAAGDVFHWRGGCPPDAIESIPSNVQVQLAHALWTLTKGPERDGSLADEGKLPSPSSSNGVGPSTESGSSAKPVKRSLKRGGGAAAQKRPS